MYVTQFSFAVYRRTHLISGHDELIIQIQETVDEMEKQHHLLTVYTHDQMVANITVYLVFAARSPSPPKCIGAIGFKKLYETRTVNETIFTHTSRTLATYFPDSNVAYVVIHIFNLHDSVWETRTFRVSSSQALNAPLIPSRTGRTTKERITMELKGDLAWNPAQLNPGPVSLAPLPASTSSQAASSDAYA
jgi:hypothetical protein